MKILILSTPSMALPPKGYAGIEHVVYDLQEGLVKKGHNVTVYATGDSRISSKLAFFYNKALSPSVRLTYNPYYFLNHAYHFMMYLKSKKFDIIHLNDAGRFSLYFSEYMPSPFVTTLHGSYYHDREDPYGILDAKRDQLMFFKRFSYVSISNTQRKALPDLNYVATVYNSIHLEDFDFSQKGGDYIAWMGRVSPTKGLDTVILVSLKLNKKLMAYGFIDSGEISYFNKTIKPLLGYPHTQFLGETKSKQVKARHFANARLLLFPIRWDEPFGIVMIEAMSCGTPVVAYARGSVPEVIKDGKTGFIVNSSDKDIRGNFIVKKTGIEGLQEAVQRIYSMPKKEYMQMRRNCRSHVEKNFTSEIMVDRYEEVYKKIILNSK
ncbi:MAG: hypothetical protein A3D74_00315 [Candidatus Levybacteria bacterium RIFCSPHIGHO2_02_FULL_37_13]|nr:MAG: hypothetical protein A3D74_00315 [Candidatus Levybacteria bacterium RIFCSPHIGHO2_02_FULL_37_13]OGH29752.1 MAG: hypothetical protein A3E40_03020 [Candidatus Levybacteria bacterium RIFCSPHIGHO2_12_FULL_37_9]OGH39424.1 MAG: hypothetical protein A3B41_01500 [Candidatus Levybacteria bacterium RIFCSPLOWO2_01_FULL_37_26]